MNDETRIVATIDARWSALRDVGLVLGTLYVVKLTLLQVDLSWAHAGPIAILTSLVVSALCLRRRGEHWAGLGLRRPDNIAKMLGWAIVVTVATIVGGGVVESAMASASGSTGSTIDPRYQNRFADVPGNVPLYLYWLSVAWIIGGFAEEMLFRAMLITRFVRILGASRVATPVAIMLQALVFGQQHFYYQGWSGAAATAATALVSGVFYVALKRDLWPLILSHGLANTIGLTLIFGGMQGDG